MFRNKKSFKVRNRFLVYQCHRSISPRFVKIHDTFSGSGSGVFEDKQDSLLRSSFLVRLGDTGAETAKERDRRQRIRFRGRGLEHEFAKFAADTGMLVTDINL